MVDDDVVNRSGNRPFEDVLTARLGRRTLMGAGAATFTSALFLESADAKPRGAGSPVGGRSAPGRGRARNVLIDFEACPNPGGPNPVISADYAYDTILPWGSPLQPGGPDIAGGRPGSAADAEVQVGAGHDGMWFFPIGGSNNHGILCINHEFGTNGTVLGAGSPNTLEQVRISQAVHGVTCVEIRRVGGSWAAVGGSRSRRITVNTPVSFSGPAAGHALLDNTAGNDPAGTVNNCANGYTPWGTYLTCEENINGYFGATGSLPDDEGTQRYGFTAGGFGYGWYRFDERFDLSSQRHAGERNRFGWVVEIDPMDPDAAPVKRTALGRFKHEGIALTVGRGGRVVGYMGDDQRFDYIYKFVSDSNWRSMRARGISPLDEGRLYVARFNDDGTGDWLELTIEDPVLAARFADQGDVLVHARIAADILGATPMDRPEWTTVGPDGSVYCSLTNNTRRSEPDAANPIAPNRDGHIIRWIDADGHTGTSFSWDHYLFALDTIGAEDEFSSPDGLWADPDGRLFIQTDGGQYNGNNQMLVSDTSTGEIRRLFAGVVGDEITGIAVTPDRRTMFINTQHPGNGNPASTNFPILGAGGPEVPRDATIVITRKDGGVIGS